MIRNLVRTKVKMSNVLAAQNEKVKAGENNNVQAVREK